MLLNNIKSLFKSSPLWMIFILAAQFAGVIIIMLAYSVYYNNRYELEASEYEGKRFLLTAGGSSEDVPLSEKVRNAFPEILSGYEDILEECRISSFLSDENGEVLTQQEMQLQHSIMTLPILTFFSVKDGRYVLIEDPPERYIEGRNLNEEDFTSGEHVCVVSREVRDTYGDTLDLCGQKYKIVGWEKEGLDELHHLNFFSRYMLRIPAEALPESVTKVEINISFKKVLLSEDYKILGDRFKEAFGSTVSDMSEGHTINIDAVKSIFIVWPSDISETEGHTINIDAVKSLKTMMLAVLFMAFVSACNSVKFFGYMLEKRRKTTGIYLICGAKRSKAAGIYIKEAFLLQATATAAGFLVYLKLILPRMFAKYEYLEMIFEDVSDCVLLVVAYSALVLAASFISVTVNVYRTPIQIVKKTYGK